MQLSEARARFIEAFGPITGTRYVLPLSGHAGWYVSLVGTKVLVTRDPDGGKIRTPIEREGGLSNPS